MNLNNLPRLRTMPADQIERNIDRCNRILYALADHYPNTCHACTMFRETKLRRMFYLSEIERRTEIENMLGTMYARNQITHAAYETALSKMIEA
jgi:hypothetical protein